MQVQFRLPPGATLERTLAVQRAVENYFLRGPRSENFRAYLHRRRRRRQGAAAARMPASGFIALRRWDDRHGKARIPPTRSTSRATSALRRLRDVQFFALIPPAIRGLGQSSGFTMELQNTGGMSREQFKAARDR